MTAPNRLPTGGRIDRTRTITTTVDGDPLYGHPGDTIASAMLASGRLEVAPSLYRRRPRGLVTANGAEPNALLQIRGAYPEPMLPATAVELTDGLDAEFLSGYGRLAPPEDAGQPVYDKKHVHADVVVVGAGPAGLSAALAAARGGARVLLVDEGRELGGSLLDSGDDVIDGLAAVDWVARAARELAANEAVRVLTRSTTIGYYDHNYLLIAENRAFAPGRSRQRLWHVRAQHVVLATGAHERPLTFADNDRPGVMLADAVRSYLHRYAVLAGREVVVATTGDSAYRTALDLLATGARVPALADTRPHPPSWLVERVRSAGAAVYTGSTVVGTHGEHHVQSARIAPLDDSGALAASGREVDCDLLATSGGWNPTAQLYAQAGGTLRWGGVVSGFVPADPNDAGGGQQVRVVGAARATYDLAGCVAQGFAAGAEASTASGFRMAPPPVPAVRGDLPPDRNRPLWIVPAEDGDPSMWDTHFVDQQRDATIVDVHRAAGTGMRSVEHVKRYTTIGTGEDQGKTSGVNTVGALANLFQARTPGQVGTTTARPPYVPVPFALMAGRDLGQLHDPVRVTPMHSRHVAAGAVFEDVGQWKRARYYPRVDEDMETAVLRECAAAREGVAMQDVSTLGRIEIVGPDAPEFLNRVYTNGFKKLAVGKGRYGMMCTADGMVFDDGVSLRLAEDRYLMSTTTGGAARVLAWLEEWLQTEWPDLRVHCTSVTEQWAAVAVVGPDSRPVIGRLAPELDVSAEAFGFMEFRDTTLRDGVPARIARVSFSGELAYEINVPSWYGQSTWDAVAEAGADYGITPYGTEGMHVLRAEKGLVIVGQDTDGTVTPLDLGMDWVVSRRKDFIGKRSFSRTDTAREDRKHLVGLLPVDSQELLPEGAQLIRPEVDREPPVPMLGHVTSSYRSAALGRTFALALVSSGRDRIGEIVHAPVDGHDVPAQVTEPMFYDKEGARRDGR